MTDVFDKAINYCNNYNLLQSGIKKKIVIILEAALGKIKDVENVGDYSNLH